MRDTDSKPESAKLDPQQLTKLLELELAQRRLASEKTIARYRAFKVLSFFFLFLVIVGAAVAYFLVISNLSERPAPKPAQAAHKP